MIFYVYPSRVQALRSEGGSTRKTVLSQNVKGLGSRVFVCFVLVCFFHGHFHAPTQSVLKGN